MKVRELSYKDAEKMLEWMHDSNVVENLETDFESKTIVDCNFFISQALKEEENSVHQAVCNDEDEYYGTVSLKNINLKDKNAEYAISMRACAIGSGYAKFATDEILKVAFEKKGLNKVYLYAYEKNVRAIKFYKKYGFVEEGKFRGHCYIRGEYQNIIWFSLLKEEFENKIEDK